MNPMTAFTQATCARCGALVPVSGSTGTGFCSQCGTQAWSRGFAGASPRAGASRAKLVSGGIGLAVVLGVLGVGGSYVRTAFVGAGGGAPGHAGYAALGIDAKHADPDAMRASVAGLATQWKRDAVWWGLNYQRVHADGTVDLEGGAWVQYASLGSAKSLARSVNQDAVKQFDFGPVDVSFTRITGVRDPKEWQDATAPALPSCTVRALAKSLAGKGLTGDKTVRVTYDPQFAASAPDEPSWHVLGEDPKIDGYFSMATCAEVK